MSGNGRGSSTGSNPGPSVQQGPPPVAGASRGVAQPTHQHLPGSGRGNPAPLGSSAQAASGQAAHAAATITTNPNPPIPHIHINPIPQVPGTTQGGVPQNIPAHQPGGQQPVPPQQQQQAQAQAAPAGPANQPGNNAGNQHAAQPPAAPQAQPPNAPAAAVPAAVPIQAPVNWGAGDTHAMWVAVTAKADVASELIYDVTSSPLMSGVVDLNKVMNVLIYAQIRCGARNLQQQGSEQAYTISEILMFNTDNARCQTQVDADTIYVREIRHAMPLTSSGVTAANLAAAVNAFDPAHHPGITQIVNLAINTPANAVHNAATAAYVHWILTHIEYHANHQVEERREHALNKYVLFVVAVTKMGNASPQWINRVSQAIQTELNMTMVDLSNQTIRMAWHTVERFIEGRSDVIQQALTRWDNFMPRGALRIRLIVEQCRFEGLTVIMTIKRAVDEFPNFPWANAFQILEPEMRRAVIAINAIDQDNFIGYDSGRKDIWKSKNYPSLGWLCQQLLIRVGGDTNLNRARGFVNVPRFQVALDTLITNFENSMLNMQPPTVQQNTDCDALCQAIRAVQIG